MRKTIRIPLNETDIREAIKELENQKRTLIAVQKRVVKSLLEMGAESVRSTLSGHTFSGATLSSITVETSRDGDTLKGTLSVSGEAILFLEFGAGLIGYGHPRAGEFGYGPGTFPGNGNWDKKGGWWYPTDNPRLIIRTDSNGQGWGFSHGTKPLMPVEQASQLIKRNILAVVTEELGLV